MTAAADPSTFPAAGLDRRFYAFTLDRLAAWTADLVVAVAAYRLLVPDGHVLAWVLVVLGIAFVVGLAFAVAQGLTGLTPGKAALGLRVVHHGTGTPIGVRASLVRTLLLGAAALPTFGLGVATLAWTALTDRGRQRRGWHDHVSESIVVDVRPVPAAAPEPEEGPRHIVNLTALRLVPTPQPVEPAAPLRTPRHAAPDPAALPDPAEPAVAEAGPPAAAVTTAERTLVRDAASRGLARWRVTFDTGESFLVEGLALVGRRPEPRPGEPVRHVVALPSTDMSLSKTHAQVQVAPDGVLVVMDRGSTNGSLLLRQGVSRELPAGKPTTLLSGDVVRLGDRQMTVVRED